MGIIKDIISYGGRENFILDSVSRPLLLVLYLENSYDGINCIEAMRVVIINVVNSNRIIFLILSLVSDEKII